MDFNSLSVLDSRYADEASSLIPYFSENGFINYAKKVEIALANAHYQWHKMPSVSSCIFADIDAKMVYEEEQKTHHQIRALVNLMQSKLDYKHASFVHLGVTSSDIQDTANVLRIRDAFLNEILPALNALEKKLIEKMSVYRFTAQIGRTHGQWAVPMTFGWWWAGYVSRIGQSIQEMVRVCPHYGQLSGAVGTSDAMSHLYKEPLKFETEVLHSLYLDRAEYSSQILPPEHMLRFLSEVNICFGVLANLADDIRNLQRSEIDEVREEFTDTQVGSSTMPHKRNPWNSEHVKSLWKAFSPRFLTFSMDLISEHQRDLTNSASSRFITEFLTGFYLAVVRTVHTVNSLVVNVDKMQERCKFHSAEKAYILLAEQGYSHAHEVIRRLTVISQADGTDFEEALKSSDWWDKIKDRYYEVTEDFTQKTIDKLISKYEDIKENDKSWR